MHFLAFVIWLRDRQGFKAQVQKESSSGAEVLLGFCLQYSLCRRTYPSLGLSLSSKEMAKSFSCHSGGRWSWSSVKREPLSGLGKQQPSLWNWLFPRADVIWKASECLPLGGETMYGAPKEASFIRHDSLAGSASCCCCFLLSDCLGWVPSKSIKK